MIQREVICSFLRLYPWNSTTLDIDLEVGVVEAVAEKVATETIFTPEGRRFYDYCRGRYDENLGNIPEESQVMPDPDMDPEEITEWVRKNFDLEDLLQLYFTFKAPELLSEMWYEELLGYKDGVTEYDEERVLELMNIMEATPESKLTKDIYDALHEKPRFPEIIEWIREIRKKEG